MNIFQQLPCRGCLEIFTVQSFYSLKSPPIKNLFTECTSIVIANDETDLPQQICRDCYTKCTEWAAFKKKCLDTNRDLQTKISDQLLTNSVMIKEEPMDNVENDDIEFNIDAFSIGILNPDQEDQPVETFKEEDIDETNTNFKDWRGSQESYPEKVKPKMDLLSCPICGVKVLYDLWIHIRDTHLKSGQRSCPICNKKVKKVKTYATMQRHMFVHTGERANICHICGKSFYRRFGLNRHRRVNKICKEYFAIKTEPK